jgi:hypothetical protein
MKKINGTTFLLFVVIILAILCAAVVWISKELGTQLAVGLGIGLLLVIVMFAQQILTGIQISDNTQNLVEYDRNQASVEEQRMKVQVVYAQTMRDTAKVQNQIDARQYELMQAAARKMAGMLSDAEIAKVKSEMMGMGMLTDNSQTIELD